MQHDPFDLARRQLERDLEVTGWEPALFDRKRKRMLASPLGFFRGTAPLFHEVLRDEPQLGAGPEGTGTIIGDMHLENVGAFRTDDDSVTFDLNDFDDARDGTIRLDVVRLATSVLLAGRTFRASGPEALALVELALSAHHEALFDRAPLPARPAAVEKMIARAQKRGRKDLLDERAPMVGGRRRLVRGERYVDLEPELQERVADLVREYVVALGPLAPKSASSFVVMDSAHRVAGTGSLGRKRIALLLSSGDGTDRLFELKEEVPASSDALLGPDGRDPAARVVQSARALLAAPMRQLAALPPRPGSPSLIGRKLCPEEDKLDLTKLAVGPELDAVVSTVGHLLGAAHARSARVLPASAWSAADRRALVDDAVRLAGIFEATYLAYARLAPEASVARPDRRG
jgi:uncharacterized protein (DUF2252 family)